MQAFVGGPNVYIQAFVGAAKLYLLLPTTKKTCKPKNLGLEVPLLKVSHPIMKEKVHKTLEGCSKTSLPINQKKEP